MSAASMDHAPDLVTGQVTNPVTGSEAELVVDLADDQHEEVPGPNYRITILCDSSTDDDREAGESNSEVIVSSEIYEAEDLRSVERRYGPFETLPAPMQMHAQIEPLKSSNHAEDRDFFEHGIQRYYRVILEAVNGQVAVPADMVEFAGYLGCAPEPDLHTDATDAAAATATHLPEAVLDLVERQRG